MKTGRKVATAEEVLVAKGENLVANATDIVIMSSPAKGRETCALTETEIIRGGSRIFLRRGSTREEWRNQPTGDSNKF